MVSLKILTFKLMKEKINKIVEIIGDYRTEDHNMFYNTTIDENHVTKWINQFDENDREFLLGELFHILSKSYLRKVTTKNILSTSIKIISERQGYNDFSNFLKETKFLDSQAEGKSQKIFLEILNEVLIENFDISLNECGTSDIKNWFYIDDVIATGGNFYNDIVKEITNYGIDNFIESNIKIIGFFVIMHTWAISNMQFRIEQKINKSLPQVFNFYRVRQVENNPRSNASAFNNVYPLKSDLADEVLAFVESNCKTQYDFRNEKYAFRNNDYPTEEKYFSNAENRIRYENILLEKGYEIMKKIEHIEAPGLRPLGMTNPTNKTLGTGTHFFTWRNISNTCPLVFWWGSNDWYPLFPVKLRGNSII